MNVRSTVATVDLAAIRHNVGVVRRLAPGHPICAVVKANAYGHGLTEVALTLEESNVEWLGVVLIEEGVSLREAGIKARILVLGGAYSGGFEQMIKRDLVPAIFRVDHLENLAAASGGAPFPYHLKIDTGMNRLGLAPDELEGFLDAAEKTPNLTLDGVLTHFANADLDDVEFNTEQLEAFNASCARVTARGHRPKWLHISNSAAVLSFPQGHLGLLRTGLMIYGLDPRFSRSETDLRPAMRWTTKPVHIKTVQPGMRVSYGGRWVAGRPSQIATLPVGYADGYPRCLSNKAHVLIRGVRAPVVGSVCMDLCLVDVTDIPGVTLADEVVLMGSQGQAHVSAYDLADWAETIPYEITCGVGPRVPRRYVDSST